MMMTPVYQRTREDCFAACLASVVGVPLSDVPAMSGWDELRAWLDTRRYEALVLHVGCGQIPLDLWRDWASRCCPAGSPQRETVEGYAIATLEVMDRSLHAVVTHAGEIVHDPAGRPFARDDDPVLSWTVLTRKKKENPR